jgi:hypothetical protein
MAGVGCDDLPVRLGTRRGLAATVALGLVLVLVLGLVGCGADDSDGVADPDPSVPAEDQAEPAPATVQHLDVVGTEYAFDLGDSPTGLVPGWTSVTFRNEGDEAHQVMFARIKDGVDPAEVSAAAAGDSSGGAVIPFVDMLGGVSYIGPGRSIEAMVDLPAGTVVAVCYVPDPDGVAHGLLGMQSALTVDDDAPVEAAPAGVEPPEVVGTIELADDGYVIPDELPAGWYRVVNTDEGEAGEGLHELSIMRLERRLGDGELDELVADLASNEPTSVALEALGGLGAISPGFEGYLHLDLPPGDYLAVDFMPDPGETRPHLLDGYVAPFSP